MDERRSLTDAALDREIQAALDVDPSPAFVARVRQRVAIEPAPAAWWRGPRVAPLAAAGALVAVVIAIWPGRDDAPHRVVPPPSQSNTTAATRASVPALEVPRAAARPPQQSAAARPVVDRAGDATAEDRFSRVILAGNERRALQWLGAATRIGQLQPAAIVTSRDRAPEEEPDLAAVRLASPAMAPPVFESVSLE